ncbi:MAG: hypothetical protein EOP48_30595 [Sphingobacteriales bacterium]|nr:MAG: hypothetical protein EOP48_30595 [Sphingobacteriales bacterium]
MKSALIVLWILIGFKTVAQTSEQAQWRYVNLHTSLFNLSKYGPASYFDERNISLTPNEIFERQIQSGQIKPDTVAKKINVKIWIEDDSTIMGTLNNGTSKPLLLRLNSGFYVDFVTEIKYQKKWRTFQVNRPLECGMSMGLGKLLAHHYCDLSMVRKTFGDYKLPFRLKIFIDGRAIISNTIMISCDRQQLLLTQKRILQYTI